MKREKGEDMDGRSRKKAGAAADFAGKPDPGIRFKAGRKAWGKQTGDCPGRGAFTCSQPKYTADDQRLYAV